MRMRPSVRCDLMSFVVCSLDCCSPRESGIINFSLAIAVASDEKCGFGVVLLQDIQDMLGVDVRPIVISDSDGSSHRAIIDASSTIRDVAELGSCNSGGAAPRWNGIVVTPGTIVELTSRGSTVFSAFATPA